jgi:hypothetical protein
MDSDYDDPGPHPTFCSRRLITHPGELVFGVMTAHPAWLQSQYDQNRAGWVIVGRSKEHVDDTVAELTPRTRHRNDNPPAANAEPHREGTRK